MSSTQSDAIKPAPFSYAQAARGQSNPASTSSSKPTSGMITPAKEHSSVPSLKSDLNGARWADSVDDESKDASMSSSSTAVGSSSIASLKSSTASTVGQHNGLVYPSATDNGNAAPTNTYSDSGSQSRTEAPEPVWGDVKSQRAETAQRSEGSRGRGSTDRASSRGRKRGSKRTEKKDKLDSEAQAAKATSPPVVLKDAPAPAVNPWLARSQVSKVAAVSKQDATSTTAPTSQTNVKEKRTDVQKSAEVVAAEAPSPTVVKEQEAVVDSASVSSISADATKKIGNAPAKAAEKSKQHQVAPVDTVAWPTPETAQVDEQKRKSQEKAEPDPHNGHEAKVKQAWNKLEFTPSVVFSTQLPATASSRRGGRGGGRAGKGDGSSRANTSAGVERQSDASHAVHGGDRKEAVRSRSPGRNKRGSHDENSARRPSRHEGISQDLSSAATEDVRNRSTAIGELSQPRPSAATKPKSARKESPMLNGGRHEQDTNGDKDDTTPSTTKAASLETQESTTASTVIDIRKPEATTSTNERKSNGPVDVASRHHERKTSASHSTFSPRGRPERGRGAHRGTRNNGHTFQPAAHSFVNSQSQFGSQGFNGAQKSPTTFGQDTYFAPSPQNAQRYGGRFPGSRAASIPLEGSYRLPNGYASQPLQVNTGVQSTGIYSSDYYSMPATAIPYASDPTSTLLNAVTQQMEYYFSFENLLKDTFLRRHMDSQGFVLLTFIADFKRLKSMTQDLELIKYICQQSSVIEHRLGSDGVDRLRASNNWDQWVLPKEDRDPAAQNDGPESLHHPPRPHPQLPDQPHLLRHSSLPVPQSAGPVLTTPGFQSLNSFAAPYTFPAQVHSNADPPGPGHFQTTPTSVHSSHNIVQSSFASSATHGPFFASPIEETEPDTFTDAEVDALKVVLRDIPGEPSNVLRAPSNPTSSNGFDDTAHGLALATQSPPPEAAIHANDSDKAISPTSSDRVNRFLSSGSRLASPRNSSRNGESHNGGTNGVYYIKDKDSPSYHSPLDTTSELYLAARDRALQQRNFHPCPPEMIVMYNFWEHFLVRNFNSRMYLEFRTFAMEDASTRNEFKGLNSLLKYYGKALAFQDIPIRRSVAQDYVNLVRSEPRESDRPAFKQLRAAWRDGALNMKNRKRVKDNLDPSLEQELDR